MIVPIYGVGACKLFDLDIHVPSIYLPLWLRYCRSLPIIFAGNIAVDDLRISALLCTRLCHDLIGPAGAVVNGVELLSEDPGAVDEEVIELIRLSAFETTRRLKFFRLALGVSPEGQMITAARTVADDYFTTSRVELDWSQSILEAPSRHPSALVPILLNLLMCGAEALPRGGRIAIDGNLGADGYTLTVRAAGEAVKIDEEALASLSGDRDLATLEARGIAPYMAARLAAAAGSKITAAPSADSMEFTVNLPADS